MDNLFCLNRGQQCYGHFWLIPKDMQEEKKIRPTLQKGNRMFLIQHNVGITCVIEGFRIYVG